MNIKTICLLLLINTQVNATSLSRLFQDPKTFNPDDYDTGSNQPILINDRILFAGRTTNGSALWALNINTLEKTEILQGFGSNSKVDFITLDDKFFFKFNTDYSSGEKIWQTDGTVVGTQLFYSEKEFNSRFGLKTSGSIFYSKTRDNELWVSDGNQVVIHPLDPLNNPSICAFNVNKVVVHNKFDNTIQYRFSNGSEVIELDFNLPESYSGYHSEVLAYNDSCYLIVPTQDSERGGVIWEINENGQTAPVNIPTEIGKDMWQIITHQDKLYATAAGLQDNVFLLSNDLSAVDASFELDEFPRMYSSGPYLALMFFPATSPPTIGINYANADLSEIVGSVFSFKTFQTTFPPLFYPINDKWLVAQPFGIGSIDDIESIIYSPFEDNEITLQLPQSNNHKVITSEDNDRVFLLSTDKVGRSELNEVASTPKVSSLMDGSWIEPNIKNQGLMLRTGKRHDGSEYLIATIYTFNDGKQFWLAGVKDIELNTDSIEIDLFTYTGLDFFEPEFDPEQTPFGSLKMQLTSCQTMAMELQTPLGTETHTMLRVDDVTATEYCVD